jgi:hypothetical protein
VIDDGAFQISAAGGGAAIGAGAALAVFGNGYVSSVETIAINGGLFNLAAINGAGVGAGNGGHNGRTPGAGGVSSVGSVSITGGRIVVNGAVNGAAIGSGLGSANGNSTVDSVTITGGSIMVGGGATGIGAGPATDGGNSLVGSLTITDGDFDMLALAGSPGIGAGSATVLDSYFSKAVAFVGTVAISGGRFFIAADELGAGIGSGYAETGVGSVDSFLGCSIVDTLSITGGSFEIGSAMEAAGIGAGGSDRGQSVVRNLSISGGVLSVIVGMRAAAIGAGYASRGTASVDTLLITGGVFELEAGLFGAGIGGGYSTRGNASVTNLTITDGTFTVNGGVGSAGIGGGHSDTGDASVAIASIARASIKATGGAGASAIGRGSTLAGTVGIGQLTVASGKVQIRGHGGIEGSPNLTIGGGGSLELVCDVSRTTCISGPTAILKAGGLAVTTNSHTIVSTDTAAVLEPGFDVTGLYTRNSESEPFGDLSRIRFPELPACTRVCQVVITSDSGYTTGFSYDSTVLGAVKSVPAGVYRVTIDGKKFTFDGGDTLNVGSGDVQAKLVESSSSTSLIVAGVFGGIGLGGIIALVLVFVLRKKVEPRRQAVEAALLDDDQGKSFDL